MFSILCRDMVAEVICSINPSFVSEARAGPGMAGGLSADQLPPSLSQRAPPLAPPPPGVWLQRLLPGLLLSSAQPPTLGLSSLAPHHASVLSPGAGLEVQASARRPRHKR